MIRGAFCLRLLKGLEGGSRERERALCHLWQIPVEGALYSHFLIFLLKPIDFFDFIAYNEYGP